MATLTPEQQQQYAQRRLGLESNAELQRRRLQEDYDLQSRLTNEQSTRDQYDVGNQLASQGLYNSGIRINEQGQVVRRANEQIGQYNLARTRGLEDVTYGLTQQLSQVAEDERTALAEANRREVEERIQQEMLQAQRDAAIRAAIPPPPPVISFPSLPPPPMYAPPVYQPPGIGGPDPRWAPGGDLYERYNHPTVNTGWNSGVGGAPKLTPLRGRY